MRNYQHDYNQTITEVLDNRTAELDRREAAIVKREVAFQEMKKPYHKKLAEIRDQLAWSNTKYNAATADAARYRQKAKDAAHRAIDDHEDARKYRSIRALLA